MFLMRVRALSPTPETGFATLVLENLTGQLGLGFLIPMNEASRLARVLGLAGCRHVPVYELAFDLVVRLEASVARIVLDDESRGICATLVIERADAETAFRCHPADAIALALRSNAPIYATAAAMARACRLTGGERREVHGIDLARWLERVRPEDFAPPGERAG